MFSAEIVVSLTTEAVKILRNEG